MTIPSISNPVCGFVPSFPGDGPVAEAGGARIPIDCYTPEPTPGDELEQVTAGGGAGSLETPPPAADSVKNHLVTKPTDGVKTLPPIVVDLSDVDVKKLPTTADFERVILDGDHYPLDATYFGFKVLEVCKSIGKRDGYTLVYQKIPAALGAKPRQYIIAMSRVSYSEDFVKVEWKGVEEQYARSKFGEYLEKGDIIYPPYNTGYWIYDRKNKKITYSVSTDPGGKIPKPTDGMLEAFPLKLLELKWGIKP